jgi:hypothetical protein
MPFLALLACQDVHDVEPHPQACMVATPTDALLTVIFTADGDAQDVASFDPDFISAGISGIARAWYIDARDDDIEEVVRDDASANDIVIRFLDGTETDIGSAGNRVTVIDP